MTGEAMSVELRSGDTFEVHKSVHDGEELIFITVVDSDAEHMAVLELAPSEANRVAAAIRAAIVGEPVRL